MGSELPSGPGPGFVIWFTIMGLILVLIFLGFSLGRHYESSRNHLPEWVEHPRSPQ